MVTSNPGPGQVRLRFNATVNLENVLYQTGDVAVVPAYAAHRLISSGLASDPAAQETSAEPEGDKDPETEPTTPTSESSPSDEADSEPPDAPEGDKPSAKNKKRR